MDHDHQPSRPAASKNDPWTVQAKDVALDSSGVSTSRTTSAGSTWAWMLLIILLPIAAYSAFIMYRDVSPGYEQASQNSALQERGQSMVANQMRDPSAAQFRNVVAHKNCLVGEVNGKNSFGGYIGFQRFLYNDQMHFVTFDPGAAEPSLNKADSLKKVVEQSNFDEKVTDCETDQVEFH